MMRQTPTTSSGPADDAPRWDVFVSYSHADRRWVTPLTNRLRAAGLRVFMDVQGIAGGAGISHTIRRELAGSAVLLAVYSADYPRRAACQWELISAYAAGLHEGDPRRRVLVINPEPDTTHIQQVELRDAKHWSLPEPADTAGLDALAADVRACARALGSAMEEIAEQGVPRWSPGPAPPASPTFVGRFEELGAVHEALQRPSAPLVSGHAPVAVAQIRGMPGVGKTLLAREYALRYGPVYSGGVFWLCLGGHSLTLREASEASETYQRQLRTAAAAMGVPAPWAAGTDPSAALYEYFAALGRPFLWVLDGVPDQLETPQLQRMCAPHPLGRTLLTVRGQQYAALATPVDLAPLDRRDACALLTTPTTAAGTATVPSPPERAEAEGRFTRRLVDAVGGHPLALDLLRMDGAGQRPEEALELFHSPDESVLDQLARGHQLPTDYPREVTRTVLGDVLRHGGPPALDVLRVAATLFPLPFTVDTGTRVLAAEDSVAHRLAARQVRHGVRFLSRVNLLTQPHDPDTTSATDHCVEPVAAHALRHVDPSPARTEALRIRTLREVTSHAGRRRATLGGERHDPREPQMPAQRTQPPSDLERMAAFDIQVELVLRVGTNRLAADGGDLREALSSLHSLFTFTRDTLREYNVGLADAGGTSPGDRTVYVLVDELLNQVLRPFLTRWHPLLHAHELTLPEGADPLRHQRTWEHAAQVRADLAGLSEPLRGLAAELATISGTTFSPPGSD